MAENYDSRLRKEILEDMLGKQYDAYENFHKIPRLEKAKKQHRQRIPLWRFLLHLLQRDEKGTYIEWTKGIKELEFKIKNPNGIASLWGSIKDKSSMTYEKLGRAMRYYYGKNIIEKVSNKRYSYRFIDSQKTKRYITDVLFSSSRKRTLSDSDLSDCSYDISPPKLTRLESFGSVEDSSYESCSDNSATPRFPEYSGLGSPFSSDDSNLYGVYAEEKYIFEDDISLNDDYDENEDLVADWLAVIDPKAFNKDFKDKSQAVLTSETFSNDLYCLYEADNDPFFGLPIEEALPTRRRSSELFIPADYNMDEIDGKCYLTFK